MRLLSSNNAGDPEHRVSQPKLRKIPVIHGPGISPEGMGGHLLKCTGCPEPGQYQAQALEFMQILPDPDFKLSFDPELDSGHTVNIREPLTGEESSHVLCDL